MTEVNYRLWKSGRGLRGQEGAELGQGGSDREAGGKAVSQGEQGLGMGGRLLPRKPCHFSIRQEILTLLLGRVWLRVWLA